ncbi:hypothetical protein [Methanobrevibacter olleyae]|uniref:Uncharacterized protein n=1 Tax=Methanobrevibacter olleyae TaxID=294671 RepID=A0A126R3T1_METOL|nr:hypothetical protein [Methanobrevibacter olleyae]AMK16325.1 hypothetical protein YLM1_1770 [Methanobrevibacter olleyae]
MIIITNKKKEMDLEDLIAETEQKILNNEYYEDVDVEYKDAILHVRIRPISQNHFVNISRNTKALETAEFHTLMIKECVINKHDNKPFTREQINKLFTGGLAFALSMKCIEVSGISLDDNQLAKLKKG